MLEDLLTITNNEKSNTMTWQLCPDVMELVGHEVLKIREVVYQNKTKYDSVVRTMQDMFRRTYNLRLQSPLRQHWGSADRSDHWDTFISDFKVHMYEVYLIGKFSRSSFSSSLVNADNGDVFYHQLSRGWGWGYKLNVDDDWYTPESEEIKFEIYGPWEKTYAGLMSL